MLKLYISDEMFNVKRFSETKFVRLNHLIFDVNIRMKPTILCVNAESNCCHI